VLTAILTSTKDLISGREFPGGPALYCSLALKYLGFNEFRVLTSRSTTYDFLRRLGVDVIALSVGETVFEIELGDGRTLKLISKSSIDLSNVGNYLSDYILISLTMGEAPLTTIMELVRGRRVVIDVQGFVRDVDERNVVFNNYLKFWELLDLRCRELVIRGEGYEFPPMCRGSKLINCVRRGDIVLVVTNGSGPIYFVRDGELGMLEPLQGIYGPTIGSGDVFTAVLTYEYLIRGEDLVVAIAKASTAATLRLRSSTPWFTKDEVDLISYKVLKTYKRVV
jgi:hypothetical protein